MRKIGFIFFVFIAFFLVSAKAGWAKEYKPTFVPTLTPTATLQEVNSYELFWPLSPGRTMASKLYTLKLWKENLRGFFIFGKVQKTDYLVFLSVKRLLEAESLLINNQGDLADKTLDVATNDLSKAKEAAVSAKEEKADFGSTGQTVVARLENMAKLLTWLTLQYSNNKTKLDQTLEAVKSLKAIL